MHIYHVLEVKEIKERWGLEKDEYILFLARIVPEKGVHYLIEAYKGIKTEKKLVIAGGKSHSTEYFNRLIKMSEGEENIIFTDFVGGRPLEELFSNAYCFVLPSDIEGMSIGLLEAMSYGNCCLVSDIRENAEVVGNKGELFLHSNADSLKEKLRKLLENPNVVLKYKEEAADYICQKYSWEKVVEETIKLY